MPLMRPILRIPLASLLPRHMRRRRRWHTMIGRGPFPDARSWQLGLPAVNREIEVTIRLAARNEHGHETPEDDAEENGCRQPNWEGRVEVVVA